MRRFALPLMLLFLVACTAETSSPAVADHLEAVLGGAQTGAPGRRLDSLVIVRLVDDRGGPVANAEVHWSLASGDGTVTPVTATTGSDGTIATAWTLGLDHEAQVLQVSAGGVPTLAVTATATAFRAISVAQGDGFGCGIDLAGDAWCWGSIYNYPASANFGPTPVRVDSGHALVEVVAGGRHACARSATTTYCWGVGYAVGQGPGVPTNVYASSGSVVGSHQFTALSADGSGYSTCGLDGAGQGWCWGTDVDGSLGSLAGWGTTATTPIAIDQGGATFTELALGYDHGCALEADGAARCWGRDRDGKLGDTLNTNSVVLQARPVTTDLRFIHIRTGDDTSCGTTASGATWCWGANSFGAPFNLGPHPWEVTGNGFAPPSIQWQRWASIRSGRVYFWGQFDVNDYQLPGFYHPTPGELQGGVTAVVQVAMSGQTLCARRVDGVVLCWGYVPGVEGANGLPATDTPVAIPAP